MNKRICMFTLSVCLVVGSTPYTGISTQASSKVYYVPGSSYAYHSSRNCRTLSRSKNVKKISKKKAKALNLRKCKVCS